VEDVECGLGWGGALGVLVVMEDLFGVYLELWVRGWMGVFCVLPVALGEVEW
jgi:hypothetical protein